MKSAIPFALILFVCAVLPSSAEARKRKRRGPRLMDKMQLRVLSYAAFAGKIDLDFNSLSFQLKKNTVPNINSQKQLNSFLFKSDENYQFQEPKTTKKSFFKPQGEDMIKQKEIQKLGKIEKKMLEINPNSVGTQRAKKNLNF